SAGSAAAPGSVARARMPRMAGSSATCAPRTEGLTMDRLLLEWVSGRFVALDPPPRIILSETTEVKKKNPRSWGGTGGRGPTSESLRFYLQPQSSQPMRPPKIRFSSPPPQQELLSQRMRHS